MRRLVCRWLGHDNVWTLDPIRPAEFVVVCLRCRNRAYSSYILPPANPEESA